MKHTKHDFRTAFIDVLLNLNVGIMVLFMLTAVLIAQKQVKDEGVKKNAQFIITAEWPNDIDCDIDMWVRDPQNRMVSYKTKENGAMYLERDDQGHRNSTVIINGISNLIDPENKEYVTVRGIIPGQYTVNVHSYSCRKSLTDKGLNPGDEMPVPVDVELVKLNPDVVSVMRSSVVLPKVWDEITVFNFTVNTDGSVTPLTTQQVPMAQGVP